MATLSVLKFNDPGGADRVLIALQGLQEQQMITLQDASVVSWPEGKKKPSACYEPALRIPAACWRKRQANATKCNPATVSGSLS